MDDQEHDEILYRLDARTKRVDETLERLENKVDENEEQISNLDGRVQRNETILTVITGGVGTFIAALSAKVVGALKALHFI